MKTKASYISVHPGQVFFFFGGEGSGFDAKWITEKILVLGVRIMDEGLETCTQIIVLLLSNGSLLILASMEDCISIFSILAYASLSYWIIRVTWWVHVLSHVRLFVTPWTVAPLAALSMEFLQAIILEWVAISFSRGSSQSRDQTRVYSVSCIAGRFFTCWATGETQELISPL